MEDRGEPSAISRYISFRADNWFTKTIDFYKIPDPFDFGGHGNNNDDVVLKPFLKTESIPGSSKFVSVGSSLFCVGGYHHWICGSVSKIYQLDEVDAAAGEDDFAVMMLCRRVAHHVVDMDGKLYTMGGHQYGIWGECFDPSSKKLSPLPWPPSDQLQKWGGVSIVVAPLHSSKKILVAPSFPSSLDVAFLYRIEDEVWEELDHMVDFSTVQGEAAVLRNNTTLCFRSKRMQVRAYHLVLKKWFESPIEGLDKVGKVDHEGTNISSLFRLDDNHLCLLWQDYLGRPPLVILHCTKVQVSIIEGSCDEFIFKAFVVSSQSYELEEGAKLVKGLAYGFGEDDDGHTEAVDVIAPNWVPVQGRTGVGSSDARGHD